MRKGGRGVPHCKRGESATILLAFPPKSGGTFLKTALREILPRCFLMRGSITPEDQSLNSFNYSKWIAAITDVQHTAVVGHIHFTPTERDAALMQAFRIAPILMRRNIADSLLSMHEMVLSQERDPAYREDKKDEMPQFGSAGPVRNYLHLTEDQQKDFLIYNFAPWFLKYYCSWEYVRRRTGVRVLQLEFDAFRLDEAGTLMRILQWVGIESAELSNVAAACTRVRRQGPKARYMHGISGRGKGFFCARHFAHLRKLADPYDFVDFNGLIDSVHGID